MKKFLIIFWGLIWFWNNFNSQVILSLQCKEKVKVVDHRPYKCTYDNLVWYPVIYEDFNNNYAIEELFNNYSFRYEDADNKKGHYIDNAISLHTAYMENGDLVLEVKMDNNNGFNGYKFATAILRTLYKTRFGIYKARVKFPKNIYMWPAVWTHYGSQANGDYEEIDWCEFFDNCPSNDNILCSKGGRYNWMRMNIFENAGCNRTNHVNTPNNFFDNYHEFGGKWTNYKIEFWLDGNPFIGLATKYSKTFLGLVPCEGKPYYTPKFCYNMQNDEGCLVTTPWGDCIVWNKVYVDWYFPHRPLQTIISNGINAQDKPSGCGQTAWDGAINNWSSFSDDQKKTKIDYLITYQPVDCNKDHTVVGIPHFKSITGGTNFLGGRKITIGTGTTNDFINQPPNPSNNYKEFPVHILATDEIDFIATSNHVIFEEGTFLRAEIIDCTVGFNFSQRNSDNNNSLPVLPIDYFESDSLHKDSQT
jgi:beta-glucanase (GH16 family)